MLIEFEKQATIQNLHGKIPRKPQFRRWENVRLNLRKIYFDNIGGIELASDMEEFVFVVLNLRLTNRYK
jgi:hypothetical protein